MKHSNRKDWLRLISNVSEGKDRSKSKKAKRRKSKCK